MSGAGDKANGERQVLHATKISDVREQSEKEPILSCEPFRLIQPRCDPPIATYRCGEMHKVPGLKPAEKHRRSQEKSALGGARAGKRYEEA